MVKVPYRSTVGNCGEEALRRRGRSASERHWATVVPQKRGTFVQMKQTVAGVGSCGHGAAALAATVVPQNCGTFVQMKQRVAGVGAWHCHQMVTGGVGTGCAAAAAAKFCGWRTGGGHGTTDGGHPAVTQLKNVQLPLGCVGHFWQPPKKVQSPSGIVKQLLPVCVQPSMAV